MRHHPAGAETVEKLAAHLKANDLDPAKVRFTLGSWLEIDPASADIRSVSGGDPAALARARALARGTDRKPYSFGS
jgi:hypothetical protein